MNFFYIVLIIHIIFRVVFYFGYIGSVIQKNAHTKPKISRDDEWSKFKFEANIILNIDFITFCLVCILSMNSIHISQNKNKNKNKIIALGIILLIIGVYFKFDAYRVIGEKGWFWYNSFVSENNVAYEKQGVYKWFDNPMYGLGYLSLIGISLILRSFPGLLLAFFDWFIIQMFYHFFEKEKSYFLTNNMEKSKVEIYHEWHSPMIS